MPERHALDAVPLTAGLLSLAVAGLTLLSRTGSVEVDGLVVLAALWLVVGLVGLGRAAQRLLHRPEPEGTVPVEGRDEQA